MLGFGIRLSFYTTWLAGPLASWIAPDEVEEINFTNTLFIAATFLALIIQKPAIQAVEAYIILLLTFGNMLSVVPYWLWRFLTCFGTKWDPGSIPEKTGQTSSDFRLLLVTAVVGFQLWYWFELVPSTHPDCTYYGFLFTKIRLDSIVLRVVNSVVLVLLTLRLCYVLAQRTREQWIMATQPRSTTSSQNHAGITTSGDEIHDDTKTMVVAPHMSKKLVRRSYLQCSQQLHAAEKRMLHVEEGAVLVQSDESVSHRRRVNLLKVLDTGNRVICQIIVMVATELTIQWNQITGVYELSSAGQTIPLVVGGGLMLRVFWKACWLDEEAGEDQTRPGTQLAPVKNMGSAHAAAKKAALQGHGEIQPTLDHKRVATTSFQGSRSAARPFEFSATAREISGDEDS